MRRRRIGAVTAARHAFLVLLAASAPAWGIAVGLQEDPDYVGELPPPAVAHLRIEGELDVGTQSHLRRAILRAQRAAGDGQARLLVELDTPGGEVELMWKLAGQIDAAAEDGVLVAAWVHSRAYSAGALIAMACDPLLVSPQAAIGAAAPVVMVPGGIAQVPDETVRAKVTSALRSSFRGWAERHGRPAALAEAMVDASVGVKEVLLDGVPRLMSQAEYDDARSRGDALEVVRTIVAPGELLALSGSQAVELGRADALVGSLGEALDKLGVPGAQVEEVPRSRSDELAAVLDSIKYLLLIAGLLAAWTEIKAPGFGLPGIAAIACIGLFLFGRYLVGIADVIHLVAAAAGAILIAVEIFLVPGTLWVGLAGGLLLIGGLVSATVIPAGGFSYPLDRALAIAEGFRLMLGLFVALLGAWGLSRLLPKSPLFSRMVLSPEGPSHTGSALHESATVAEKRERLLGALGVALTDLRPVGKVRLDALRDGDLEARVEGLALDRGARVRVVDVSSGRLVVGAAPEAPPPATTAEARP